MTAHRRNETLRLESAGLEAARLALAPVPRRRMRSWRVLACAGLMTLAALSLCAVVLLDGGAPQGAAGPSAGVHGPFRR